jgi:N-acetylglucosaminyldiphosphoundecaprenol N-acetyl-beta-D-mannosaminyltransferase
MSEVMQDDPNSAMKTHGLSEAPMANSPESDGVVRPEPCVIGHLSVDRLTFAQAIAWLSAAILNHHSGLPLFIAGTNAFISVLTEQNPRFREAMSAVTLIFADGQSIVLASRLLNKPVPERIPGGELMTALCAFAAEHHLRIYLLGGLPGAAKRAADKLKTLYPNLEVAGTNCPSVGFELDQTESAEVREKILAAKPDLIFVALGCPKQEIWVHENSSLFPVRAIMPVGAAFDTLSGLRLRAPKIAQQTGTEWLFRLMMEPRRLWKRYLIGNFQFAGLVLRQMKSR